MPDLYTDLYNTAWVEYGLAVSAGSGLTVNITPGVAYIPTTSGSARHDYGGGSVSIPAISGTYFVDWNGNSFATPSGGAPYGYVRLASVATDGTSITGVTDLRPLTNPSSSATLSGALIDFGPPSLSGDDTLNLMAALTQAWAVGGTIVFGPYEYRFNTSGGIALPVDDAGGTTRSLRFLGTGSNEAYGSYAAGNAYGTRLRYLKGDGTDFLSAVAQSFTTNLRLPSYYLQDLTIIGPDATSSTTTSGNGVTIGSPSSTHMQARAFLDRVNIMGFQGSGKAGLTLRNVENGSVKDVMVQVCDIGMQLLDNVNAVTFINPMVQLNTTIGCLVQMTTGSGGNMTVPWIGGMVQSNLKDGLIIKGALGWNFLNCHFENNNSSNTAGCYALQILGQTGVSNQHLVFDGCKFSGTSGNDKVNLVGNATGVNAEIAFRRGYVSVSGTWLTIGANCQDVEVQDVVPLSQISDSGTRTSVTYRGTKTVSGLRTPYVHQPSDQNYRAWTDSSLFMNAQTTLTTQTVYLERIDIDGPTTISQIDVNVRTIGATLTAGQNLIGIYDSNGNLLYTSPDQSSAWSGTTGIKSVTGVNTAVTSPFIWIAILSVGTTPVTLQRYAAVDAVSANAGLTVATSRAAHLTATGTTLPASFAPGSGAMTQDAVLFWVAIK